MKEKTRAIDRMRGEELESYLTLSDPNNEVMQALQTANESKMNVLKRRQLA